MLWDITTKFLPVQDLIRSQLSTKFEECSLKNDAATPLTISNFSRAWQAYFWSYTLQILCENTTFIDVQMMCSDDFDISSGFRFGKISVSCSVHFYSLYLDKHKDVKLSGAAALTISRALYMAYLLLERGSIRLVCLIDVRQGCSKNSRI